MYLGKTENGSVGGEPDATGEHENVCAAPRYAEQPQMALQLRRESRAYGLRILCCVFCFLLSMALLAVTVNSDAAGEINAARLLGCLLWLVAGAALIPRTRSRVLEAWRQRPNPCMIGPLLDALGGANGETAGQIQSLLTTLLPMLDSEEAAALTLSRRRRLHNALLLGDADRNTAYLQAVARALAQCADEQTLVCLRQMVRRGAITEGQQWVLESIRLCLPDVEAQVAARQSGADLLRASSPAPDPAQLLRAAQSARDAAPDTLLRPDDSPK